MTSIKDVAKKAGVSVATVSRVINQTGNVKEETRLLIEKTMEELNYHPNALARALNKNKQSKIIGLLSMSSCHPFFAELIYHIGDALEERGYKLLLLTSYMDIVKEKKCTDLVNSQIIDGLLIGSFPIITDIFLNLPIPVVTIEIDLGRGELPVVRSNNYQGGCLGARHLIAKGCKKIVFISGPDHETCGDEMLQDREKAFLDVCRKEEIWHRVFYVEYKMENNGEYSKLINQIFYEIPDVDGIFCYSDLIAAEVMRIGSSLGYSVPEKLKVIGFDGTIISRITNPPLTTVAQDIHMLAEKSVEKLIAVIENQPYEMETIVPVELIERQTT